MRGSWLACVVALGCGGGGGTSGSSAVDSFCEASDGRPDCDAASTCEDRFIQGRVSNPRCVELYDAFAGCLSSLEIACKNGADFEIHANGDGTPVDEFIETTGIPYYLFYVTDAACQRTGHDLETCVSCSAVTGYPGGIGVGDRCGAAGQCAAGLTCRSGMCTKPCSNPDECKGTKDSPRTCQNEFALDNLCEGGMCTSESDVANNFCADYGAGWTIGGAGLFCVPP